MNHLNLTLVDTSVWIDVFRGGKSLDLRKRITDLTIEGRAAWCDMVKLELWNGTRGEAERKFLRELESDIIHLPINHEIWQQAIHLAQHCRKHGYTIPSTDILIASCAHYHHVPLEHCDKHFDILEKLLD